MKEDMGKEPFEDFLRKLKPKSLFCQRRISVKNFCITHFFMLDQFIVDFSLIKPRRLQ